MRLSSNCPATRAVAFAACLLLAAICPTSAHALQVATPPAATPAQQQPSLNIDRDPVLSPDPDPPPQPIDSQQGATLGTIARGAGGKYTLHTTPTRSVSTPRSSTRPATASRPSTRTPSASTRTASLQSIASFRHEDLPVSLGILIDSSGSMYDKRAAVDQTSLDLIKLSNPEDEAFLVDFSWEAFIDQDFTSDISKLQQGLTYIKSAAAPLSTTHSSPPPTTSPRTPSTPSRSCSSSPTARTTPPAPPSSRPSAASRTSTAPSSTASASSSATTPTRTRRATPAASSRPSPKRPAARPTSPSSLKEVDPIAKEVAEDIRTQYTHRLPLHQIAHPRRLPPGPRRRQGQGLRQTLRAHPQRLLPPRQHRQQRPRIALHSLVHPHEPGAPYLVSEMWECRHVRT